MKPLSILSNKPVCGTFSKGGPSAMSLNFCRAGSVYCSRLCRFHPETANPDPSRVRCYAVRTIERPDREQLRDKLIRHETLGPLEVTKRAICEVLDRIDRGNPPAFFRLSTDGSVPSARQASPEFIRALRSLLLILKREGIPVHFPVETRDKAEFYRSQVGDLVTVRESLQTDGHCGSGAISRVAGANLTGRNLRARRLDAAKAFAEWHRIRTGRKTIVCPAVANHGAGITCDRCKACSKSHIDIVFPAH